MTKPKLRLSFFMTLLLINAAMLVLLSFFLFSSFGQIYKNEMLKEKEYSVDLYIQNNIKVLNDLVEQLGWQIDNQKNNFIELIDQKKFGSINETTFLQNIIESNLQIDWTVCVQADPVVNEKTTAFKITGNCIHANGNSFKINENKSLQTLIEKKIIPDCKSCKKSFWSEPFIDPIEGDYSILYSVPLKRENKIYIYATAVSFSFFENFLAQSDLNQLGKPFLYVNSDLFFQKINDEWKRGLLIKDFSETAVDPQLKDFYCRLKNSFWSNREKALYLYPNDHFIGPRFYFGTMNLNNWRLGCEIDGSQALKIRTSENNIFLFFSFLGITLALTCTSFIIYLVVRPFKELAEKTNEIVSGHYSNPLHQTGSCREIADLVIAFDKMRHCISNHFLKITGAVKKEELLKAPLKLAGNIQKQMLPHNPQFLLQKNIELYARTKHALDTGGDFYDYRMIDEKNMYFCIGDVSDSGVSGSWFMALGLTFIRVAIFRYHDPAKVLLFVNRQLKKRGGSPLFMSALCGIYSLDKNEITVASAGFNPPILINRNMDPRQIEITNGLPLAITDDPDYQNTVIKFRPGDLFFAHTDEILYAMNKKQECFGPERLLGAISSAENINPESIGRTVIYAVRSFKETKKMMDDMTVFLFKNISEGS